MLTCILPDLFSIARPFFEKYLNPVTMALFVDSANSNTPPRGGCESNHGGELPTRCRYPGRPDPYSKCQSHGTRRFRSGIL